MAHGEVVSHLFLVQRSEVRILVGQPYMNNLLDRIFFRSKNLDYISQNLKDITNQTPANKIFEAINNYSESSEVRYVGGCIRKVIKKETVDDIDLATNLKPNEVCEALKKKNINFYTNCEHHFVPIIGKAHVAYISNGKVIGLSKLNRIVQYFAKRPQVQERLTQQILVALQTLLDTDSVAVRIKATHYCVKSRGVMDTSSQTETTALGGQFKANPTARAEFLS